MYPKNETIQRDKTDKSFFETYNAPVYDMANKKIGNVVFNDVDVFRQGKLYVTEDCTIFFDDPHIPFGSSLRFMYSFLSLSGDSFWPPNSHFTFKMMYGTGRYYDTNYRIDMVTGKYNRTVSLIPITTSGSSESSNDDIKLNAALVLAVISLVVGLTVATLMVAPFKSASLGSQESK